MLNDLGCSVCVTCLASCAETLSAELEQTRIFDAVQVVEHNVHVDGQAFHPQEPSAYQSKCFSVVCVYGMWKTDGSFCLLAFKFFWLSLETSQPKDDVIGML